MSIAETVTRESALQLQPGDRMIAHEFDQGLASEAHLSFVSRLASQQK
jgi:hypothetical protein